MWCLSHARAFGMPGHRPGGAPRRGAPPRQSLLRSSLQGGVAPAGLLASRDWHRYSKPVRVVGVGPIGVRVWVQHVLTHTRTRTHDQGWVV